MGKLLIIIGAVVAALGVLWLVAEQFGLGRLPGDFVYERGGVRIYIPLMTSLIISVVLSLIFWALGR